MDGMTVALVAKNNSEEKMDKRSGTTHGSEERRPDKDIRKDYDPYERDPGAGRRDDDRVSEADEQEARQREGVHLGSTGRLDDSTTSPVIDRGQPGQTTRGSYGFNSSTGQG